MKKVLFIIAVFFYFFSMLFLVGTLSGCHALVVADKLYFQGSVAKKLPNHVEVNDTVFVSDTTD